MLLAAVSLLFISPRLGYATAALAGVLGLYWFFRLELGNFPAINSWIALNLPDTTGSLKETQLRLGYGISLIFSTVCAGCALFPASWYLGGRPVREHVGLTLAVAFGIVAFWYFRSISPYRVPVFSDGPSPELAILYVEKHGLQFHETGVSVYRNGEYYYSRDERKLFQHKFVVQGGSGVLTPKLLSQVKELADSQEIRDLDIGPSKPMRSWRAGGWYVSSRRKGEVATFTTENGKEPPKEFVHLFQQLLTQASWKQLPAEKDVCFGFCYDSLAVLHMANLNDRCGLSNGTRCE